MGRKKGGREGPGKRRNGPSPAFFSAVPVSLPKNLEKCLSLPASHPLKERERSGGVQPPAARGSGSNSPSHQLAVLPFHPCGNVNSSGSWKSSVLTTAPILESIVSGMPTGTSSAPQTIISSLRSLSVPSPSQSLAHTRGA